jgi:hypothetical protein
MDRFDERTPLRDYDNGNDDERGASGSRRDRSRAEQAARRYGAAGEPGRDDDGFDSDPVSRERRVRGDHYAQSGRVHGRQGATYGPDWNDGREGGYDFDGRMHDGGRHTSSFWPSELGYPASRGYSPYGGRVPAGSDFEDRGLFERAGDEVRSWFGDRDARRRREVDHRGRGPKNYARSDERICDDINERLTEDIWIDASDVEVGVTAGEVVLNGTVEDRHAKRRAEDCAEDVPGVKHVQNNLRYVSGIESPRIVD